MYGFPSGTTDADVINTPLFFIGTKTLPLSNAKLFSRHVGITYDDLFAILQTRFVNPNSDLIPKLERLGVTFATLKELKDGTIADAEPSTRCCRKGQCRADPAEYGGDIKAWVKNDANFARIMALITLTDPTGNPDPCNFRHSGVPLRQADGRCRRHDHATGRSRIRPPAALRPAVEKDWAGRSSRLTPRSARLSGRIPSPTYCG